MRLSLGSYQVMCLFCLAMFLCALTSGAISHDPKYKICCKPEMLKNKTEDVPKVITKCFFASETPKCAKAVILRGKYNRMHCIDPETPWLNEKLKALEEKGVQCQGRTKP